MKTKEEILKSKLPHQFQYGWFGANPTIEWEKAIEAMEEYAQQKTIEFGESLKKYHSIKWVNDLTTEELYKLFKEEGK